VRHHDRGWRDLGDERLDAAADVVADDAHHLDRLLVGIGDQALDGAAREHLVRERTQLVVTDDDLRGKNPRPEGYPLTNVISIDRSR
jgi:hypothetical protein